MHRISDPAETCSIADPELRQLIEKTMRDLSPDGPYDAAELGFFLIVEPGDSLEAINKQLGWDIMTNVWTRKRFGEADFTPSFELVEEHPAYYELVYVIGQDGFGIEVFIPKTVDIPVLLALCKKYAVPAPAARCGA
jgi:hypothetical protein